MQAQKFKASEVISYIEDTFLMGTANEHHEEVYFRYMDTGKIDRNTYAVKKIQKEMKRIWNEGF